MIGVIIPDRGDRPEFLSHCLEMLKKQIRQPDRIYLMNETPESSAPDLTMRIRKGFEQAKSDGCEAVLIIENDDFYSPWYIDFMLSEWDDFGKPDIFGLDSTLYYHIIKREFRILTHPNRASLMSTLIKCSAEIIFPDDSEIFLDLNLWKQLKGKTVSHDEFLSIGIKHGQGLCGGKGHSSMTMDEKDPDFYFLRQFMTADDLNFYQSISAKIERARSSQSRRTSQLPSV